MIGPLLASVGRRLGALRRSAFGPDHVERLERRLAALEARLGSLEAVARRADRAAMRLELEPRLDAEQRDRLARLPEALAAGPIAAHVAAAVAAARLHTDPCDYVVIDNALPDAFYALLLDAMPPEVFFEDRDRVKQNLRFPVSAGPALTRQVWTFMDEVVAGQIVRDAVIEKFREGLARHCDTIFGPEARDRARALPYRGSGGRLMLRRPGYHLRPHRDPKRSMLTCLLYLARPGDSEAYGTQLYRVADDVESRYKQTYYPEADGHACELVTTVPFRPNTLLVMLNARGAHGVDIPSTAPADVERYAYQCYITPEPDAFATLLKGLPRERRAQWKNRDLAPDWWKTQEGEGSAPRTTAIT